MDPPAQPNNLIWGRSVHGVQTYTDDIFKLQCIPKAWGSEDTSARVQGWESAYMYTLA